MNKLNKTSEGLFVINYGAIDVLQKTEDPSKGRVKAVCCGKFLDEENKGNMDLFVLAGNLSQKYNLENLDHVIDILRSLKGIESLMINQTVSKTVKDRIYNALNLIEK